MPSLHPPQQVPPEVRVPNAGFTCAHFQLDGPHRVVSTAGTRRWLLPPEYMYPIELATQSGLVGPWRTPDIGELPAGLNPGNIEPWGISNFQIFPPNIEILIYGGWYLLYRYWPTSHNTHRFEAFTYFSPARTVRERIEHEVASVVLKEFALQDAGMLGGAPRPRWKPVSSTSSRSTTRRSWSGICTKLSSTGSMTINARPPGGRGGHSDVRSDVAQRICRTRGVRSRVVPGH